MVFDDLFRSGRRVAALVDPDKASDAMLDTLADPRAAAKLAAVFLGGSLVLADTGAVSRRIRQRTGLPLVLFPGNLAQLTPDVDAVLFLSLISGRNPEYLIGQHVVAAPMIRRMGVEPIPVGYMLFDCGGAPSSVRYMSGTQPIPSGKADIAVATAMAGEMLGLRALYLEAGSGAERHVPVEVVSAVRASVSVPLIVGGGVRGRGQLDALLGAGADLVVLGTALERDPGLLLDL